MAVTNAIVIGTSPVCGAGTFVSILTFSPDVLEGVSGKIGCFANASYALA